MASPADRSDLSQRIARLSPEKRELLRTLLVRESAPSSSSSVAPDEGLLITPGAVSGHEGKAQGKAQGRRLYELINRNLDRTPYAADAVFLNFGYVANENPRLSPVVLPPRCLNRNGMQLALEVIADVDLRDEVVADVGCGRGGTIALMKTYFAPRRVVGVDYSKTALEFCKRTHRFEGVHFVEGNAHELPLGSGRFGVVTNIESASGYDDIERFYREAHRVLRRGGYFLYADVIPRGALPERRRRCADIGFAIENERDITSNVLVSCDETARVHQEAVGAQHDEEVLGIVLGLPGHPIYRLMKEGSLAYVIFKMRRIGS